MATATTVRTLTTEELAKIIEEYLLNRLSDSVTPLSVGVRMIYEDMLLAGSSDEHFVSLVEPELRQRMGIVCSINEINQAGFLIREKSLKARGLR